MPTGVVTETIPASSGEVFHLLHDYDRRLTWDTLLRYARLEPGFPQAELGAVSVCAGRWQFGGLALRTRYVTFHPGRIAAVQMINRPPFFDSFAASIRHEDAGIGASTITYRYAFQARPRILRPLLHPIMALVFRYETRRRLRALRDFFRHRSAEAPRSAL